MRYALSNSFQADKALESLHKLIERKKDIELTVKHKSRSNQQNSYYHVLVVMLAIHMGEPTEIAKYYLKLETGHYKTVGEYRIPLPTANLDKMEMKNLTEKAMVFIAQQGIRVDTPEEYYRDSFGMDNYIEQNGQGL